MNSYTAFLISVITLLMVMFFIANAVENRDINAVSMYFVVFTTPALLVAFLNAVHLHFIRTIQNKGLKIFLSLLPVFVMLLLSLKDDLTFDIIDGNLIFVTQAAVVALGFTNLLWLVKQTRQSRDIKK
jgi:hypothetical protein